MFRLLGKFLYVPAFVCMIALLGAYLAPYVNPNTFVVPALLGLAYPYLLILNLIFLFYWLANWHRMFWIALVVIIAGIPAFMSYYGTAKVQDTEPKSDLAVLSYNVRYFDFYHWSGDRKIKDKLLNYLNSYKGDVICLQEFSIKSSSADEKSLIKRLKKYPYHYVYDNTAIFSRVPIIKKGHVAFETKHSGACLYCDLKLGRDTVRVYSIHLESYRLGQKERAFMQQLSQGKGESGLPDGARRLTTRLTSAKKYRAEQAELIHRHIRQTPWAVVVCGDFNDTPLSYTYHKIKTGLNDAFIECGQGLGNTYIGEWPSFRIDYILHTPNLKTLSYRRDTAVLSDHYSVRASFSFK